MHARVYLPLCELLRINISKSEFGFCDYDVFSDDRGTYIWNEAIVGDPPQERECYYEPQHESGGKARRQCSEHQHWSHPNNRQLMYDGFECVTRSTAELRNLSRV